MDKQIEAWVEVYSTTSGVRALGIESPYWSQDKYLYRVNDSVYVTNITRTTGWHEFKLDYTSGTKVDMYIDGTLVASPTGVGSFNYIMLGDRWANGIASNTAFDDISIK